MNQQESLFVFGVVLLLLNSVWKWSKLLMILVLFELVSSLFLFLIIMTCSAYLVLFFMFLFFVSEALVVVSSFYNSLRLVGVTFSSVVML